MAINISDNSPRVSYTVADGVTQTSFTVSFIFFAEDDLNVYVDGTLKTLETDYTVTGGDGATGSITMSVTGASGGSSVVVTRSISLDRATDFPTSGPFQVDALNTELDRLTGIVADLDDKAGRGLQLTDYDLTTNLTLPDLDARKGRTLAFNATSGAVEAGPTISDVQTISAAAADIATLADIEDGTDATDAIQTAATNATEIATVSGSIANVNTVSTNIADVNTTAINIADVTSVATNMTEVLAADTNAATATTKAAEAASSATAAAASETAASTSETNAATSETNAASSATAAAGSATSASTAQTAAETAQTAAETAQTAAETAETNAATSETNAATSATNAANSATAAAASQVAAAASASAAANTYDTFDDRYLGTKTADPTVDNDGDALVQGMLYFNSTSNEMRVYDGGSWIAASSAGGASMLEYLYIATASQTAFSGSDENSNTLSYTAANLIVIVNGVVLEPSVDYTATDGLTVTLTDAAALNDEVHIIAFKSFTTADMVSATNGGTFGNNITVTGTVTADGLTVNNNIAVTGTVDGTLTVGDEIEFEGDSGSNGLIQKNASTGRDELQIYAGGVAYDAGSVGAGIHLYGNSDSEHDGNFAVLTGPDDNGDARMIVSGRQDKANVTIGNSIWDYVDDGNDHALLNLKDPSGQPALLIEGASGTEGDIVTPTGEALQFGHWDKATSTFTERFRVNTAGVSVTGAVDFGDWTITESGGALYFAVSGTNVMKVDGSGNIQVTGDVETNATIT